MRDAAPHLQPVDPRTPGSGRLLNQAAKHSIRPPMCASQIPAPAPGTSASQVAHIQLQNTRTPHARTHQRMFFIPSQSTGSPFSGAACASARRHLRASLRLCVSGGLHHSWPTVLLVRAASIAHTHRNTSRYQEQSATWTTAYSQTAVSARVCAVSCIR